MNQVAVIALIAWPVVSLTAFALLARHRAALITFGGAWLLLPPRAGFAFEGLPEYTKNSAPAIVALLFLIIDFQRIMTLRPRLTDLLMAAWCFLVPLASVLFNGLPIWNVVTFVTNYVIAWGIPYLVGRIYFKDQIQVRDLAVGITILGLFMFPIVLFEIINKQTLAELVYGVTTRNQNPNNWYKWGLFNMEGFFDGGKLEIGLWSTLAAITSCWLWRSGAVQRLFGLPMGFWTLVLIAQCFVCHQTGAIALMLIGLYIFIILSFRHSMTSIVDILVILMMLGSAMKVGLRVTLSGILTIGVARWARLTRPQLIALCLVAAAPIYLIGRTSGVLSGKAVVFVAQIAVGPERAWSLRYRLIQEDKLLEIVMNRPLFGYGSYENSFVREQIGATDSLWMIILGRNGLVGISLLYGIYVTAALWVARRYRVTTWTSPAIGPIAALFFTIILFTFDSLLNATAQSVLISLFTGTLAGLPATLASNREQSESESDSKREDFDLKQIDQLIAAGRRSEAQDACRRLIASRSLTHQLLADVYDRLAGLFEADGFDLDADEAYRRSLKLREPFVANPTQSARMAYCYERVARLSIRQGDIHRAIESYRRAHELRENLAATAPTDVQLAKALGDVLNDLAWLLAESPDPTSCNPQQAVMLAKRAVHLDPSHKAYWNTLAAAYYRSGDLDTALATLNRSRELGQDGGEFDEAIAALTHARLGNIDASLLALDRLDTLIADRQPISPTLKRLRSEANQVLENASSQTAKHLTQYE